MSGFPDSNSAPAHRAPISMARPHLFVRVRCASCDAPLELECEGLPGFWGYQTYNEFHCPQCRKRNFQRTSGAIVAVRLSA